MLSFEAHAPISCHRATSTGLYMCSDSMYSERMNLLFYPLGYMDHIVLLRCNRATGIQFTEPSKVVSN